MYISISDFVTNSYGESWDSSCEIHESQFTTIESQFKNKSPGSLCNHTVNLKTDSKTLYIYSLLKWKYTPSIVKHNKEKKKFVSLNNSNKNSHRNHTNRTFFKNILRSINRSLRLTECMPQIILCLWGFLCIRDAGCRGNKITALSNHLIFFNCSKVCAKGNTDQDSSQATCSQPEE